MDNDFCDLPQELQTKILSNLDAVSLTRCAMTCKSIYEIVQNSSLLVYTVQLHLDGLEDGVMSTSHPDSIETIARRRQAWRSLNGKKEVACQTRRCYVEELVGGVFASMTDDCLEIIRLPTSGNVETRMLKLPLIGISAREFTMDPTQDLLVFLDNSIILSTIETYTICVHVCSLSTNTIHPQAQQSPLQFTVANDSGPYWNSPHRATFQIAYNILAAYVPYPPNGPRVLIWDWTTSDLILDTAIAFEGFSPPLRYDFGLLDPMYFFITCPSNSGSIRLYRLGKSPEVTTHLATLHFPPTSPGTHIRTVTHVAGPIEAKPPPHLPFMVHDEDRLHLFKVQYAREKATDSYRGNSYFNLFLHQRVLLKYARQALTAHSPLDIPWAAWGSQDTRFVESPALHYASPAKRYIHGQRVFFHGKFNIIHSGLRLYIVDFSLAAVLFAKGNLRISSSFSEGKPGTLLPPSFIPAETVPFFLEDVKTHLLCVLSLLNLKKLYATYMIYGDGVVGADMKDDRGTLLHIFPIQ